MRRSQDDLNGTPWITFWRKPRETFEYILRDYAHSYSFMLALIAGFGMVLQSLFNRGVIKHEIFGGIYLEALIIGPIFGVFCFYLGGWLLSRVARWYGGNGSSRSNRVVWAWSFVPYIVGMVMLWIPITLVLVLRTSLMLHLANWAAVSLLIIEVFFYLAFIPFWAWSVYLIALGLKIVNNYDWKGAILTLLTAYIIVSLILWTLLIGVAVLFGLGMGLPW